MEFTKDSPEITKRQAEIIAIREELAKLSAELITAHTAHDSTTREMILEVEMEALNKESQRIEAAMKHALDESAEVSEIS
jgi:hypothetical protein